MTISAWKKLQVDRNMAFERRIKQEKRLLEVLSFIQNNYHCRRQGDGTFEVRYFDSSNITCVLKVPTYDSKLFWIESERFFDLLGVDPENIKDSYWNYSRDAQASIKGVIVRFELHFIEGCTPIKRTVSYEETVGFACG